MHLILSIQVRVIQKSEKPLKSIDPEKISTILNIIGLGAATLCHEYSVHSLGTYLT
jgi:hypothetical protein